MATKLTQVTLRQDILKQATQFLFNHGRSLTTHSSTQLNRPTSLITQTKRAISNMTHSRRRAASVVASAEKRAHPVMSHSKRTLYNMTREYEYDVNQTERITPSLDMLSEDEIAVRKQVSSFAEEHIAPYVKDMDENAEMRPELIQKLFEHGMMGVEIDRKYGGPEASFFHLVLALEELAKVDLSVSLMVDLQNTISDALLIAQGTEHQKQYYLPRLAGGMVTGFCMSERDSGSDAFAMHTQAVKQGDNYIINGSKQWTTNGEHAELLYVMANANPQEGYRGITCFLVPRDTLGVSIGKTRDKLGARASSTCSVYFNHVEIPECNVLGEVGQGYHYALDAINAGRITMSAQMVGLAQGCLDKTLPYIRNNTVHRRPIWQSQSIQHQVAQAASQLTAVRLMVYNAARRKMNGLTFTKEAAMSKYLAAEMAQSTTSKCIEWCGREGALKNNCIEKYYRDCKLGSIYEGTSNIQLNTIAKYLDLNR